jgi:hypothetical protein
VILGEQLCGFIVAVRQDIPWAYMMPIEPILDDIKQKFGTSDVRLPKRGEIESLALSSKVSEARTVVEEDGQTPGSDGRQVSKAAVVPENLLPLKNLPKLENSPGLPSEKSNHSSNRQEDETIDEKYSVLESIPEPLSPLRRRRAKSATMSENTDAWDKSYVFSFGMSMSMPHSYHNYESH